MGERTYSPRALNLRGQRCDPFRGRRILFLVFRGSALRFDRPAKICGALRALASLAAQACRMGCSQSMGLSESMGDTSLIIFAHLANVPIGQARPEGGPWLRLRRNYYS